MTIEHCICCGEKIPEGSWVCPKCSDKSQSVAPITHIIGIPIAEAVEVLSLYKYGIPCPNKDYRQGFEDGYSQAMKDQKEAMDKMVEYSTSLSAVEVKRCSNLK